MIEQTQPDVAVILTPHPTHALIALDCIRSGCHVLIEKPIGIEAAEADALIAAADTHQRLVAVNFQQRARPEIQAARKILQAGELGAIQRVEVVAPWTRTRAYYQSSSWRATWQGEGGGVLMNQAPHDLDLVCFLLGMPARVFAWTRNLWHQIETEDTVHAVLEWRDGTLGYFHASTAEGWRDLRRFELIGTQGYLQVTQGHLRFERSQQDLRRYLAESKQFFDSPDTEMLLPELDSQQEGTHIAVYQNLMDALSHGVPLLADARSASLSLELANGMLLASKSGQPVEFPLQRSAYHQLLTHLQSE
jgi:predicted dehydrogenase